jgi:SAM-dependent methyltransferase
LGIHELTRCIVCGGSSFETLHEATFDGSWEEAVPFFLTDRDRAVHGTIIRCRECGFTATSPQFSAEEYSRIYHEIGTVAQDNARRTAAAARSRKLANTVQRHRKKGRFLDLGCGDGSFLRAMPGFDGRGFEVRSDSGQNISGDERIVVGDFLEYCAGSSGEAAESFDFATAWDVFEHFPNLDEYVASIHGILNDRGHLFCTLPNVKSLAARLSGHKWNCFLVEHLWYFTPATFRRYMRRFGFEVLSVEPFFYPVDIQTILFRVMQTYGGRAWRFPPIIADRVVSLPFGLMLAVCRKN